MSRSLEKIQESQYESNCGTKKNECRDVIRVERNPSEVNHWTENCDTKGYPYDSATLCLFLAQVSRLRPLLHRLSVIHGITSNFAYCTANRANSQYSIFNSQLKAA